MIKVSTLRHWDKYWGEKKRVDEIYSNEDRIIKQLERVISLQECRVLEIGAGTGRDSLGMLTQGAKVFQLDYSFEALRLMKQTEDRNGLYRIGGDAFHLPFRNSMFDIVFHQGLLEHFGPYEAERLLKEHIRVLKKGGYLLVDVPQRYHLYTVLKRILIAFGVWFAGWEKSFSYLELRNLMEKIGLQPVHRYGEWMVPSLLYRVVREGCRKIGVRLPLYPPALPYIGNVRKLIRSKLLRTPIPLYTGINIGIIAKKL